MSMGISIHVLRGLCIGFGVIGFLGTVQAADIVVLIKDTAGNHLEDAVVVAEPLDTDPAGTVGGDTTTPTAIIAQLDKQFVPYVSVIRVGTAIDFPNRDKILHNVYSFSKAKPFQLPLYKDKPPQPIMFDKPGVVILGCNIHDWMVAYVYVVDTPYFAKSDSEGRAVLTGVPPGLHEVRAWHPRKKRRGSSDIGQISVTASGHAPLEFTVALKPEWRPHRPSE
jgi:plastocyanin